MSPTQSVTSWLKKFNAALTNKDIVAATDLFADESYWRDLVSFTWNIKTMEGKRTNQCHVVSPSRRCKTKQLGAGR